MVSFIIRTLNEGRTLGKVIELINKLEDKYDKEIIIVDSGSTDNTIEIANKYKCKIVKISKSEFSWGRSLNRGIQHSSGDYIVIISAHCFIKDNNFLKNAITYINNYGIAAVYGQQIAIPFVDPFEELELKEAYPNISSFIMDHSCIYKGKAIGISNACCVLKKKVWEEYKFDEDVQSLEDYLWVANITQNGFKVGYSNTFAVYHSHDYDVRNIYKRWNARTYESCKFIYKYLGMSRFKRFIKKFFYREYLYLLREKRVKNKYELLNKEYKKFISKKVIREYQMIVDLAVIDGTNRFFNKSEIRYSKIELPQKIIDRKIADIGNYLKKSSDVIELIF